MSYSGHTIVTLIDFHHNLDNNKYTNICPQQNVQNLLTKKLLGQARGYCKWMEDSEKRLSNSIPNELRYLPLEFIHLWFENCETPIPAGKTNFAMRYRTKITEPNLKKLNLEQQIEILKCFPDLSEVSGLICEELLLGLIDSVVLEAYPSILFDLDSKLLTPKVIEKYVKTAIQLRNRNHSCYVFNNDKDPQEVFYQMLWNLIQEYDMIGHELELKELMKIDFLPKVGYIPIKRHHLKIRLECDPSLCLETFSSMFSPNFLEGCLEMIKLHPKALFFMSKELWQNVELVCEAVKFAPEFLLLIDDSPLIENERVIVTALKANYLTSEILESLPKIKEMIFQHSLSKQLCDLELEGLIDTLSIEELFECIPNTDTQREVIIQRILQLDESENVVISLLSSLSEKTDWNLIPERFLFDLDLMIPFYQKHLSWVKALAEHTQLHTIVVDLIKYHIENGYDDKEMKSVVSYFIACSNCILTDELKQIISMTVMEISEAKLTEFELFKLAYLLLGKDFFQSCRMSEFVKNVFKAELGKIFMSAKKPIELVKKIALDMPICLEFLLNYFREDFDRLRYVVKGAEQSGVLLYVPDQVVSKVINRSDFGFQYQKRMEQVYGFSHPKLVEKITSMASFKFEKDICTVMICPTINSLNDLVRD